MPQVVACHRCQQRFMAEDFLLGTVVPCPSCGTSLAIPAATPVARAASHAKAAAAPPAAGQPLQPTGLPLFDRMGVDPRQRQKVIALAVVMGACVLWLLLAAPSLWHLAWGRPLGNFEKTAAGAVIFWVGVLAACGGILEWSFFMDSYKMRSLREWFGYEGARWFYVGVGGMVSLMGLGLTFTTIGFIGPTSWRRSPERPDFAIRQEHVRPHVASQAAPPPPPSAGKRSVSPRPTVNTAASDSRKPFEKLPGTWVELEGGFCVKVPAAVDVPQEDLQRKAALRPLPDGSVEVIQRVGGHTTGNPSVYFMAEVQYPLPLDDAAMQQFQRERAQRENGRFLKVNGLTVLRTETHKMQPGALTGRPVPIHGVNYYCIENRYLVTLTVYSGLPIDDAAQKALQPYLDTFQRMPKSALASSKLASSAPAPPPLPRASRLLADGTRELEGGFRLRLAAELEIREDSIARGLSQESVHRLTAESADRVRVEITVVSNPKWNHPNPAAAAVERAGQSGFATGQQHAAVDLQGLVMEKITISDPSGKRRDTKVEYKYLEGRHQITMQVWAELPLDDPSFQAAIRSVESISRSE